MITEEDIKEYFSEDEWNGLSASEKALFTNFSKTIDISSVSDEECETQIRASATIKTELDESIILHKNSYDNNENLQSYKEENISNPTLTLNNVNAINGQVGTSDRINCCIQCRKSYEKFCPDCPIWVRVLDRNVDKEGENRERATLPKNILAIRNSTEHAEGVFTLMAIPEGTVFGPCEGLEVESRRSGCTWKLQAGKLIIAEETSASNWMQYVNSTEDVSDHNLTAFQYEKQLYFQSNRTIEKDEELLLYYGSDYRYSKQIKSYCPMVNGPLGNVYACTVCCLGFRHACDLLKHKLESCHMFFNSKESGEEIVQCAFCKIYLNVKEYKEIHRPYCRDKHVRKRLLTMPTPSTEPENELCRRSTRVKRLCRNKSASFEENTVDRKFTDIEVVNKNNKSDEIKSTETRVLRSRSKIGNKYTYKQTRHEDSSEEIGRCVDIPEGSLYQCKKCEFQTNSWQNFRGHLTYKHNDIRFPQYTVCDDDALARKKRLKCSKCDYRTNRKDNLLRHKRWNHEVFKFHCAKCYKGFSSKYEMQLHTYTHKESRQHKPFKCPACPKSFKQQQSLNEHKKVHAKSENYFKCSQCEYKTDWKGNMKQHMRDLHENVTKRYSCPKCDYRTDYKSHLNHHGGTHGDYLYQCDICRKGFGRRSRLERHILTHQN